MNDNTKRIAVAISKGRVTQAVQPLLVKAGIGPTEDLATTRKLVVPTQSPAVDLVIVRSIDVPTYVQLGGADFGIVGKDVLLEIDNANYFELLDLDVCKCELVLAGVDNPSEKAMPGNRKHRVATKYVNTARRYFAARGEYVNVMHLSGSMELAPLCGLADRIVDLSQSGNTLRSNGLKKLDTLAQISARLIASKASTRLKTEAMKQLADRLEIVAREHK